MESDTFYYYRTRNRLFFIKKYAPFGIFPLFFVHFLIEVLSHTLPTLYLSHQKSQIKAVLYGIFDFLRGKRGPWK
jgi:hypothetical protein